jgi:hypothetical protein
LMPCLAAASVADADPRQLRSRGRTAAATSLAICHRGSASPKPGRGGPRMAGAGATRCSSSRPALVIVPRRSRSRAGISLRSTEALEPVRRERSSAVARARRDVRCVRARPGDGSRAQLASGYALFTRHDRLDIYTREKLAGASGETVTVRAKR